MQEIRAAVDITDEVVSAAVAHAQAAGATRAGFVEWLRTFNADVMSNQGSVICTQWCPAYDRLRGQVFPVAGEIHH